MNGTEIRIVSKTAIASTVLDIPHSSGMHFLKAVCNV